MATSTSQRVFIWVIAVVMVIGTLGAYFMIIVANQNQNDEIAKQQELLEQLQKQQTECQALPVPAGKTYTKPAAIPFDKATVTALKTEDVAVGEGAAIDSVEDCVTVHYLGNTSDGNVFDNSYDKGQPIAFTLTGVIAGWQQGLQGMKVGGKRTIYIPSNLAYGEAGSPPSIGPNEPLVFQVELVGIK